VQQIASNNRTVVKGLLFIFWPLFSYIYALFTLNTRSSRVVVVLFYGLCGYFYPFSFSDNIDVVRHAKRFMELSNAPFVEFWQRFAVFYVSDEYKPDILQPLIEFVVSRFTSDYRIYFVVLSMTMAWALMYLVKVITKDNPPRTGFLLLILVFFILILIPPYRIGGFRQITGMMIFCAGAYQVIVNGKRSYHLMVLATGLVHFSFLSILPFYVAYFVIGQRYWIYYCLILAAFLLQNQAHMLISDFGGDLEGQLGQRIRGYTNEEYIQYIGQLKQNRNILVDNQIRWTTYALFAFLLLISRRIQQMDTSVRSLYAFSLSLFIFTTFVSNLETTFVRFSMVHITICAMILIRMIQKHQVRFSLPYQTLIVMVVSFNLLIMTRKSIEYTGSEVLYPGLPVVMYMDPGTSILKLLK
jgi:hypothetical protein